MGSEDRKQTSSFVVAAKKGELTRRMFLGSAASVPIAAQARHFGRDELLAHDEADLDISHKNGLLKIAIRRGLNARRRDFWSKLGLGDVIPPDTDPGGSEEGTVWAIETARFGPKTKVRFRNGLTPDGRRRYTVALHDISYGRVSDRRLRIILEEHLVPDTMGEALFKKFEAEPDAHGKNLEKIIKKLAKEGVPRLRVFSIRVTTNLWSLTNSPQGKRWFELRPPEATDPAQVIGGALRLQHWIRSAPRDPSSETFPETPTGLALLVDAGRVTSTLKLIFNGQVGYSEADARRNVLLSFDQTGTWRVSHRAAKLQALTDGLSLDDLTLRWQRAGDAGQSLPPAEGESQSKDRAGELTGDGPFELVGFSGVSSETKELTIKARGRAPGLTLSLAEKDASDTNPDQVRFRVLEPRQIVGGKLAPGQLRSEASLLADWSQIDLTGQSDAAAGPFHQLRGRLMERVDAPARMNDFDYAKCVGNIGFGADFTGSASRHWRVSSPIGPIGFRGLAPDDETDSGDGQATGLTEDPFRQRHGDQVQAVYSWGRSRKHGFASRARPRADWIELNGVLREAAVQLEGADFNRLTFSPTHCTFLYVPGELAPPQTSYVRLAPPTDANELAQIDLSDAALVASRTDDLLGLTFRFSDFALSLQRGGRTELVRRNAACRITTDREADGRHAVRDDRPVLVVEFPGQHLFEEAFFAPKLEELPDVRIEWIDGKKVEHVKMRVSDKGANAAFSEANARVPLAKLDDGATWELDPNDRQQVVELLGLLKTNAAMTCFRIALKQEKIRQEAKTVSGDRIVFADLAAQFASSTSRLPDFPADQVEYIGPFALDPDAMRLASKIWKEMAKENLTTFATDLLVKVEAEAIRLFNEAGNLKNAEKTQETILVSEAAKTFEGALALERRLETQFPSYQLFRTVYRNLMIDKALGTEASDIDKLTAERFETVHVDKILKKAEGQNQSNVPLWMQKVDLTLEALTNGRDCAVALFAEALRGNDKFDVPARARIANPSRLAFRVKCRDGISVARNRIETLDTPADAPAEEVRDRLQFSLASLTRFADFDLSVVRRAQAIYRPSETGRIDALSRRRLDLSHGARLDHLGFTSGRFVTSDTRLGEIAASLKEPPQRHETAIEIPSRLTLSPDQNAVVLAPSGRIPDCVYFWGENKKCGSSDALAKDGDGVSRVNARLWSANFLVGEVDPNLRAVHSPDLRPDVFAARSRNRLFGQGPAEGKRFPGGSAPPRGPFAPWHLGPHETQTASLGVKDAKDPIPTAPQLSRIFAYLSGERKRLNGTKSKDLTFRAALDAYARHELVLLSSAWGLPVLGRRTETGKIVAGSGQAEVEPRFQLVDVEEGSAFYEPRTLGAIELSLTPIGGTLRHASSFEPFAAAFDSHRQPLFDATSVESWQQWTNLGRDVHCEIVYKGFLWPVGQRASLVQVTERDFFIDEIGAIRAILRQRLFIRVGKAEKLFPALKQPTNGRRFPVTRLRNLTTQTPDIVDPSDGSGGGDSEEYSALANGRVVLGEGAKGLVFWPRTARLPAANIRFELDLDGTLTDLPMIFVDNVAANDETTLGQLADYYNALPTPDPVNPGAEQKRFDPITHVRTLDMGGEKRRYAAEKEAGSASCETKYWTLCTTGLSQSGGTDTNFGPARKWTRSDSSFRSDPLLQGADQPPFYPALESCRIRARQAERLIGGPLSPDNTSNVADPRFLRAVLDGQYIEYGLPAANTSSDAGEVAMQDNVAEAYLALVDQFQLGMGSKGNQSGGVFRPSGRVVGLSRTRGALTWSDKLWPKGPIKELRHDEIYSVAPAFSPKSTVDANGNEMPAKVPALCSDAGAALINPKIPKDLEKIKKLYSDIVDGNAKILGLVSIKDLFEFIENLDPPSTGMPKLAEQAQYGAKEVRSAIGDVDNAVGDALERLDETVDLVRNTVILPLSEAVTDIREGWEELDRDLASYTKKVPQELLRDISFAKIFPDLHCTLVAFEHALRRAMAAADALAFTLAVSEVYSAGRRFLDALFRAAADPGRRLEASLRSGISGILELGAQILNGRIELVLQLASQFISSETSIDEVLKVARFVLDKDANPPLELSNVAKTIAAVLIPDKNADGTPFRMPVLIVPPKPEGIDEGDWNLLFPTGEEMRDIVHLMLVGFLRERGNIDLRTLLQKSWADVTSGLPWLISSSETVAEKLLAAAKEALEAAEEKNAERPDELGKELLAAYRIFLEKMESADSKEDFFDWLQVGVGDEWTLIIESEKLVRSIVLSLDNGQIENALEDLLALARLHFGPLTGFDDLCENIFDPFAQIADAISPGSDGLHAQLLLQVDEFKKSIDGLSDHLEAWEDTAKETQDKLKEVKKKAADAGFEDAHEIAVAKVDAVANVVGDLVEIGKGVDAALAMTKTDIAADKNATAALAARLGKIAGKNCSPTLLEEAKGLQRDLRQLIDLRKTSMKRMADHVGAVVNQVEGLLKSEEFRETAEIAAAVAAVKVLVEQAGLESELKDQWEKLEKYRGDLQSIAKEYVTAFATKLSGLCTEVITLLLKIRKTLQQDAEEGALKPLPEKLAAIFGTELNAAIQDLDNYVEWLKAAKKAIDEARNSADPIKELTEVRIELPGKLIIPAIDFFKTGEAVSLAVVTGIEDDLTEKFKRLSDLGGELFREVRAQLVDAANGAIKEALSADLNKFLPKALQAKDGGGPYTIVDLYNGVRDIRDRAYGEMEFVSAGGSLLLPPNGRGKVGANFTPGVSGSLTIENDRLAGDVAWLKALQENTSVKLTTNKSDKVWEFVSVFVSEWRAGRPTPVEIVKSVEDVVGEILKGDIFAAIDFTDLRSQIEDYILSLVPTQIDMSYSYGVELGDKVRSATMGIFAPGPGSKLTVDTGITIDLGFNEASVNAKTVGRLGPFDVKLVGDAFDALTLKFNGAEFTTETGKKMQFDISYSDYEIGPMLEFVQQFQSFLTPKGNSGFYLEVRTAPIGVEAGYILNLGDFSVGAMAISNVGLATAAILPFEDADARFKASLSTRMSPFTITYTPYGGSGFFGIEANANGILGFEASFEFGGSAVFAFGPLSGTGRLMAGFYIRQSVADNGQKLTELSATFFVGGTAQIWIFSFAASLSVRLGMVNGDMSGEAIFSFSFSMGLADFEYSVTLFKREAKGFGGDEQASLLIRPFDNSGIRFADMGLDAAGLRALDDKEPRIDTRTACQARSWKSYSRYFTNETSEDLFE